jgi:hypothetical protein
LGRSREVASTFKPLTAEERAASPPMCSMVDWNFAKLRTSACALSGPAIFSPAP